MKIVAHDVRPYFLRAREARIGYNSMHGIVEPESRGYTKCTHTKEEGCAIMAAKAAGRIPESRHESFRALYDILKNKHDWDKKS